MFGRSVLIVKAVKYGKSILDFAFYFYRGGVYTLHEMFL